LHERAENFFAERKSFVVADDDFNAERMARLRTTSMVCG